MAKKDAAFQGYIALYREGLINDNLLPLLGEVEEISAGVETRSAFEDVSTIRNPWEDISKAWSSPESIQYKHRISIDRPCQPSLAMDIVLPREIIISRPSTLYWDERTAYTVTIGEPTPDLDVDTGLLPIFRRVTAAILRPIYSRQMREENDFLALFLPNLETGSFVSWLGDNDGSFPATQILGRPAEKPYGLIREPSLRAPHIFYKLAGNDCMEVIALPKRRDYVHHGCGHKDNGIAADGLERNSQAVPVHSSMVERLELQYVECSLLIPSLLHLVWRQSLARDLSDSILPSVGFVDINLVITATNAPAANEPTNYQRLEFIGDSVLKYLVSLSLYLSHPSWPEGYLTQAKHRIIANSRLARAAVETGIDRYIVTDPFTAKKWRPPYISDDRTPSSNERRTMSTKVLADVAEALIGGALLDGGLVRASLCVSRLLSEVMDSSFDCALKPAHEEKSIVGLEDLERLLGYTFKDRHLLREALTHPSCENDAETSSYQRLEFIGDAVLDMIIISYLVDHAPQLPHGRMHLIKMAIAQAGFLAHVCLDTVVEQGVKDIRHIGGTKYSEVQSSRSIKMCHFMQHQQVDVTAALTRCIKRHDEIANEIRDCLDHGSHYPWVLLTSLEPEKFLSDLVESIFGAILIDARGDLAACTAAAKNLGIYKYLCRIVAEEVDLLHPKNKLGELAGSSTVEYEVRAQDDHNLYSCKVIVGDDEVAMVLNGLSKEDAMTRAAEAAIRQRSWIEAGACSSH